MKWIFRYLRGSSKFCLSFGSSKPVLKGYIDADMVDGLDGIKSTFGYFIYFCRGNCIMAIEIAEMCYLSYN